MGLLESIKKKFSRSSPQTAPPANTGGTAVAVNVPNSLRTPQGGNTPGFFARMGNSIKNKFNSAKDFVKEKASNFGSWVSDKAGQAKDWVKDKAGKAKDWATEKAGKAKDWIVDKAGKAESYIKDKAFGIYDKVANGLDDFKDWRKETGKKIKGKFAQAKDWVKGKASAFGNAVKNSKFGQGVASAAGWVKDKAVAAKDWVKEKFAKDPNEPGILDKIKNSKFGKGISSAANWVKDKASAFGSAVKNSKFGQGVASAANWVKNKAGAAKDWASDKLGKAKDWLKEKFASDPNEPGLLDKIKNSKFGKGVASAANWVKDKAVAAKDWTVNKFNDAKGWVKDKATAFGDWLGNTSVGKFGKKAINTVGTTAKKVKDFAEGKIKGWKHDFRVHDLERIKKRKIARGNAKGEDYTAKMKAAQEKMQGNEMLQARLGRLKTERLASYNESKKDYSGPEPEAEESGWLSKDAKEGFKGIKEALSKDDDDEEDEDEEEEEEEEKDPSLTDKAKEVAEVAGNAKDAVTGIKDTVSKARKGKQKAAVQKGFEASGKMTDTVQGAMKFANKDLAEKAEPIFDKIGSIHQTVAGTANMAMDLRSRHKVKNNYTDEQLREAAAGDGSIDSQLDQEEVVHSRENMVNSLNRDAVTHGSEALQGAIKTVGNFTGPGGKAIAKVASKAVGAGSKAITGHMLEKENKHIAQEALFGSREEYKKFKHENQLDKEDMRLLILGQTGADSYEDLVKRARLSRAQTLHKLSGNETIQSLHEDKNGIKRGKGGGAGLNSYAKDVGADPDDLQDLQDYEMTEEEKKKLTF